MPPRARAPKKLSAVPDAPASGLTAAVEETLGKLESNPEDAAVRALAVEYARTIDRAAAIAAQVARLPFDPETADAVEQMRKKVAAHATMADLGPKLLASLDALHATPKARAAAGGKPTPSRGSSRLAAIRDSAGA